MITSLESKLLDGVTKPVGAARNSKSRGMRPRWLMFLLAFPNPHLLVILSFSVSR